MKVANWRVLDGVVWCVATVLVKLRLVLVMFLDSVEASTGVGNVLRQC